MVVWNGMDVAAISFLAVVVLVIIVVNAASAAIEKIKEWF
jgi:uncharacterized protein YoxC